VKIFYDTFIYSDPGKEKEKMPDAMPAGQLQISINLISRRKIYSPARLRQLTHTTEHFAPFLSRPEICLYKIC